MKIGIYLESRLDAGGGFQQALTSILSITTVLKGEFEFVVYTTEKANVEVLRKLGIVSKHVKKTVLYKTICLLLMTTALQKINYRLRLMTNIERRLIEDGVDLVYFVTPSNQAQAMQKLNFLFTVWDLCHLDHPEFPEGRSFGEFEAREYLYSNAIKKSFLTLVDSQCLAKKIVKHYGVDENKLLVMPFSAAREVAKTEGEELKDDQPVLQRHGIKPGYLFYPAQFWPHKNHRIILEAVRRLKDRSVALPVVFCGSNKHGNWEYLRSQIKDFEIEDQVVNLDFVPSRELPALYRNALALVMPTYFGPTNLPPLEAWTMGTPVLYPKEYEEQTGDGALYFDTDDSSSLAECLRLILDESKRETLITNGHKQLQIAAAARKKSVEALAGLIRTFQKRRICWK